jgi:hypothetical protein
MVTLTGVNWFAVLVCMVICVISGSIWYNPKTFFKRWWTGIGKTEADIPGAGSNMKVVFGLTFVSSFVQPLILAVILQAIYPHGASIGQGIALGAVAWTGFVAPTYLTNKLFAGYPFSVWLIETSNHLINFILFGLVLAAWS